MKLLFDQNISFRLISLIKSNFPEAKQVRELNLENASDKEIWNFAKENCYTIVTFDADFNEIANVFGFPPKIIWLKTGNLITSKLAEIFNSKNTLIEAFITKKEYAEISCLEII